MKKCSRCEINKNLLKFPKSKNSRDGVHNQCKKCHNEYYSKEKYKKYYPQNKNRYYLKKFNITLKDKEVMIQNQSNTCLICKQQFKASHSTHVDHNHITGKVRGILCSGCNMLIGFMETNPKRLEEAFNYLLQCSLQ